MRNYFLSAVVATLFFGSIAGFAKWPVGNIPPIEPPPLVVKKTMRPFGSDQELINYFRQLAQKQRRDRGEMFNYDSAAPQASYAKAGSDIKEESITNTQEAGVDEGGIVKLHGDQLVVLRRGRLFTIRIGDGALQPISMVDAFGPDMDPRGTWYDELLVSDNTAVVIGYSYEKGGTEIGLFNLTDDGKLSYRSSYHLRSNDYYSSRNYASRLIGTKLILYAPLYLNPGASDPFGSFPAVRKWHRGAIPDEFQKIVTATHVYRPEREFDPTSGTALHTVTVCDLANGGFDCNATSVIGPPGRVFYVSQNAVYIWVTDWIWYGQTAKSQAMLYRMPFDGSGPSALTVSGSPVDQFSFLESEDNYLNVLVRDDGHGDSMWNAESSAGSIALLRVPLSTFSDGRDVVDSSNYHSLPRLSDYTTHNRFVGDFLLYGNGNGWGEPNAKSSDVFAVRWATAEVTRIALDHSVDRLEQMGTNAVVIGTNGPDLHFSAIRLDDQPAIAGTYVRKNASQGELRSQGFFYKPDGTDVGTLGLPVSLPARAGYHHLFNSSSAILFLKNNDLHFEEAGQLSSHPEGAVDDSCRASCIDWYGNSRPLFIHGRIFALLGYEIVEGANHDGRLQELRRISYAPRQREVTTGGE